MDTRQGEKEKLGIEENLEYRLKNLKQVKENEMGRVRDITWLFEGASRS